MSGQLTLALIKPHIIMERRVGEIFTRIEKVQFSIILSKMVQICPHGADIFYEEHKEKDFFEKLKHYICVGPVWALVLSKENAVEEWRKLMGETDPIKSEVNTIRSDFGRHDNIVMNAVHGSSTDNAALREIHFFFSREIAIAEGLDNANNQPII